MNTKALITIGMVAGSAIGGYVPSLWGADPFSLWSVVLAMVGGFAGIWAGYKLSRT
jgi:predicted MFS family arabinose efflux permease